MPLDLTSLSNSLDSLTRAVRISENLTLMKQYGPDIHEIIQAGVVKNFEITYELAYKLLDRWLQEQLGLPVADLGTRRNRYRIAAENGLIRDFGRWIEYHKARNASSHEYDEVRFHEIYVTAVVFPHDARLLLDALREHND